MSVTDNGWAENGRPFWKAIWLSLWLTAGFGQRARLSRIHHGFQLDLPPRCSARWWARFWDRAFVPETANLEILTHATRGRPKNFKVWAEELVPGKVPPPPGVVHVDHM